MNELLIQAREEIKLAKEMMELSEMLKKKEETSMSDEEWNSSRIFEEAYEKGPFDDFDSCIAEMYRNAIMLLVSSTDKLCEYRHSLKRKEIK